MCAAGCDARQVKKNSQQGLAWSSGARRLSGCSRQERKGMRSRLWCLDPWGKEMDERGIGGCSMIGLEMGISLGLGLRWDHIGLVGNGFRVENRYRFSINNGLRVWA